MKTFSRAVRLAGAAALLAGVVTALPSSAAPPAACTGAPGKALSTEKVLGLAGSYTLPAKAPTSLVVIAHGYRSWSGAWQKAMVEAAAKHNAIAVAVDYRGLLPADEYHSGWPVKAGSEDLTKVAATFAKLCPSIATTALFSVGMGGNAAGLALAHGPARFTYWVDVAGATDLYALWASLSAFGGPCLPTGTCLPGIDTYYATIRSDIEAAAGGAPPYEDKAGFDAIDPATQLRAAGTLGVKGVAVVHAVADGSVPYGEGVAMTALLHQLGVPTDFYTVGRGGGGSDLTIAGNLGQGGSDPMAGYESDGANDGIVIKTGLSALWGMVDKGGVKPSNQNQVVNG
jgi:hypothetical protein